MHLLLIDPTDIALDLIPSFLGLGLDVGIVVSFGEVASDKIKNINDAKIIDLNLTPWDKNLKIVSAITWSYNGLKFLESINDQIILSNVTNKDLEEQRIKKYLNNVVENTLLFTTLSYKGRHVLIAVFKYTNGNWNVELINDCDQTEAVWQNLDSSGIINGPCQTYLFPDGTVKNKFHLPNSEWIIKKHLVNKHFLDIWPTVIKFEETNPKKSINSFYDWVDRTGNAKRFSLRAAGKI